MARIDRQRQFLVGALSAVALWLAAGTAFSLDTTTNQVGRLTSVGNTSTRTFHQYDQQGRIIASNYVQDGQSRVIETRYGYPQNADTTLGPGIITTRQIFPDGEMVFYGFDASGQQTSVRRSFGGTTEDVVRDYRLNARGQIVRVELGNGTVTTRTYDEGGHLRLERLVTVDAAGRTIQDYSYTYDGNGNVTGTTDALLPTDKLTLHYDSLDQLQNIVTPWGGEQYAYDGIGNLIRKGVREQKYESGKPHALSSSAGETYTYDRNGNVATIGANTVLEWNADNMPVRVTAGSMVTQKSYVGETLWKKVEEGVTTYYLPSMRVENGIARKYYGNHAERFEDPNDRQLRFYHPDHLGSSSVMTDQRGVVIRRVSYLPWGDERGVDATFTPRLQFNFKEKDANGLYDYGARLYRPGIGRWLSADTHLTDGLNRYAYVRNNPWTSIDPTGHFATDPEPGEEDGDKPKEWTWHDWLEAAIDKIVDGSVAVGDGIDKISSPWSTLVTPLLTPASTTKSDDGRYTTADYDWDGNYGSTLEARVQSQATATPSKKPPVLYLGTGNGDSEEFFRKAGGYGASVVGQVPDGASDREIYRVCGAAIKATLRAGGTVIMDMRTEGGRFWKWEAKFIRRIARECPECVARNRGDGGIEFVNK